MWNMDTFKKIGEACGGLLEVALETVNQSFLRFVKLKVKGFYNGFLHPIAKIQNDKETIHVGLFSLGSNPSKGVYRLGFTKGILASSLGDFYVDMLLGGVKKARIL